MKPKFDGRHRRKDSGEGSRSITALRKSPPPDKDNYDFKSQAKRKARVILSMCEKGKANPCAESGLGVGWLTRYLDMKEGPGWGLRYRNEFKLARLSQT